MQLRQVFDRGQYLFPDKDAIVDGTRRFTWRQWVERQNRLANALLNLGMRKGDRLGLLLKNCAEYFDAYGAGARTGIVIVPINFRLNQDGIRTVIEDAGCSALLVDLEFIQSINGFRYELTDLRTCISVGGSANGMLEYESMLLESAPNEPEVPTSDDDLAVVIYTTGTTGAPKGAMATRRITMTRLCCIAIEMEIKASDRYLSALPIFHISGVVALGFVFRGATNVILRDFEPEAFCRLVQDEKISKTTLAPAVVNFVLNWPNSASYDLSSLRMMLYGAAPMSIDILKKTVKLLPACSFVQGFGSSECFTSVVLTPEDHAVALAGGPAEKRLGAAGRSAILAMAKVVKTDGSEVNPGEIGEVFLKGGMVTSGYLNKHTETTQAMADGWFKTQDIATVDEEGYIYVVDRKSHMIITGGENVYPAQIENVLFGHPKIAEAAVIGIPDRTWGEVVMALVVVRSGETLSQQEVIDYCAPRMANYAKPKTVEFVEALPHTATGKLDKLSLKKKYWHGYDRGVN